MQNTHRNGTYEWKLRLSQCTMFGLWFRKVKLCSEVVKCEKFQSIKIQNAVSFTGNKLNRKYIPWRSWWEQAKCWINPIFIHRTCLTRITDEDGTEVAIIIKTFLSVMLFDVCFVLGLCNLPHSCNYCIGLTAWLVIVQNPVSGIMLSFSSADERGHSAKVCNFCSRTTCS